MAKLEAVEFKMSKANNPWAKLSIDGQGIVAFKQTLDSLRILKVGDEVEYIAEPGKERDGQPGDLILKFIKLKGAPGTVPLTAPAREYTPAAKRRDEDSVAVQMSILYSYMAEIIGADASFSITTATPSGIADFISRGARDLYKSLKADVAWAKSLDEAAK